MIAFLTECRNNLGRIVLNDRSVLDYYTLLVALRVLSPLLHLPNVALCGEEGGHQEAVPPSGHGRVVSPDSGVESRRVHQEGEAEGGVQQWVEQAVHGVVAVISKKRNTLRTIAGQSAERLHLTWQVVIKQVPVGPEGANSGVVQEEVKA